MNNEPPERLYFFLSYARGDDDSHVHKFFRDLCSEVRSYAGVRAGQEVGFLDNISVEIGAAWSPRLLNALSRCHLFVALMSPRYVVSDNCGKEWTVFTERMHQYEEEFRVPPSVLLPLLWVPTRRTPAAINHLQYNNEQFPDAYRNAGLRQLMRIKRYADHYVELVSELARQIVETADLHPLPPARTDRDFRQIPSVFKRISETPAAPGDPTASEVAPRPQYAHLVVAAPATQDLSDELSDRSNDRGYYGPSFTDWAPFRPTFEAPLVRFAEQIAQQHGFDTVVADTSGLRERIDNATRANQIVIMLVDPWATRLSAHRQALAICNDIDRGSVESRSTVMVPSAHSDDETQRNWQSLVDSLRAILLHRSVNGDSFGFRLGILTHKTFQEDLQIVLEVLRNRVFRTGSLQRRIDGEQGPRPILDAQ